MNMAKSLFSKLPISIKIAIRQNIALKNPLKYIKLKKTLDNVIQDYIKKDDKGLEIKDGVDKWNKSFKKFIKAQPSEFEVATEFFKTNIQLINKSNVSVKDTTVTLICVVKNDLLKLKKMINHHRSIGVKHFAIIDNDSTDGTIEWLKDQEDVDLFYIDDKYTTNKRESWINRIISYYGFNKWYLILDSDELFVYSDMEEKSINQLVRYCKDNNIFRLRALMIDMYANDEFYEKSNDNAYIEECKYFDTSSYNWEDKDKLDLITGGPRGRIFNQNAWLTKYPLYYFVEGDIQGKSHFLFPFYKNKNTKCLVGILHYKFLPSDIEKYRKIALDGNYFNGSLQYKNYINYIDKNGGLSFKNDKSEKYINSKSIYKIKVLDKLEF